MNKIASAAAPDAQQMTREAFEAAIRSVGAERYHDKHPFHELLHRGKLDKGQVQAWALSLVGRLLFPMVAGEALPWPRSY